MSERELLERINALAIEADKRESTQLIALILYALCGAITGGLVRSLARHVARWNDEALKAIDAGGN